MNKARQKEAIHLIDATILNQIILKTYSLFMSSVKINHDYHFVTF